MILIKDNGEETVYEPKRLKRALMKSGASEVQVNQVMVDIEMEMYENMPTRELYQLAHKMLKTYSNAFAARYSLKKALLELGPAGFYFERWVGRLLEHLGYRVLFNQIIQGHAVSHEADVIAEKDGNLFWIECKFRNTGETKIPVTTPMYVLSRIKDISNKKYRFWGEVMGFTSGILVTNSYFTLDSINFSEYYGLRLLAWDFPDGQSIKNLVDMRGIYPITCLTTLDEREKKRLLAEEIILVKDIKNNYKKLGLDKIKGLKEEVKGLLSMSEK